MSMWLPDATLNTNYCVLTEGGGFGQTLRDHCCLYSEKEMAAGKGSVRKDTAKQQEGLHSFCEEVLLKLH